MSVNQLGGQTIGRPGNTRSNLGPSGPAEGRISFSLLEFAGADPSGKLDSAEPLRSAYRAASTVLNGNYGGTLNLPCGTYRIGSTVAFTTSNGVRLIGSGGCTLFLWTGDNRSPMFLVQDCYKCEFANFVIRANSAKPLAWGIQQINSGNGPRYTSILNRYLNIEIQGTEGYLATGILFGGGVDANNDQTYLESVYVENYSHSAFTIDHSQVYEVVFQHCGFFGDGFGKYGVESLRGNFHWRGAGSGGGNTVSDFFVGSANGGAFDIDGGRFEGSARFLTTGGPGGNVIPFEIRGVSFSADCLGNSADNIRRGRCSQPGGDVIDFKLPGILQIRNSRIGQVQPAPGLTICMEAIANPEYLVVEDSTFASSNTTVESLFAKGRCALPERFLNSSYLDPSGVSRPYGDHWLVAPAEPALSIPGGTLTCAGGKHLDTVTLSPSGALTGTCD